MIPNRKTGTCQQVTTMVRDAIVSSVTNAVRYATGCHQVKDVDIHPLLEKLPDLAEGYAIDNGLDRPPAYADRVPRFVEAIESKAFTHARQGRQYVLPDWLPLYESLEVVKKSRPERASAILRLQNVVLLGVQVRSPAHLPERSVVKRWAKTQKFERAQVGRMLDAYRLARRARAP